MKTPKQIYILVNGLYTFPLSSSSCCHEIRDPLIDIKTYPFNWLGYFDIRIAQTIVFLLFFVLSRQCVEFINTVCNKRFSKQTENTHIFMKFDKCHNTKGVENGYTVASAIRTWTSEENKGVPISLKWKFDGILSAL